MKCGIISDEIENALMSDFLVEDDYILDSGCIITNLGNINYINYHIISHRYNNYPYKKNGEEIKFESLRKDLLLLINDEHVKINLILFFIFFEIKNMQVMDNLTNNLTDRREYNENVIMPELRKVIYPNFLDNNLVFDHKLLKTVEYDPKIHTIIYMSYFLRDDNYDYFFTLDLKEINNMDYKLLFIFRIGGDGENLEDIEDRYRYQPMCDILNNTTHSDPFLNILTEDNFPTKLDLTRKLNKNQMNDKTGKSTYSKFKRNLYMNICSIYVDINSSFYISICSDYELEDYPDYIEEQIQYIRIIINKVSLEFYVDINSIVNSYDYENYDVFLFAIPNSYIPVETSSKLLLSVFEKEYNNNAAIIQRNVRLMLEYRRTSSPPYGFRYLLAKKHFEFEMQT